MIVKQVQSVDIAIAAKIVRLRRDQRRPRALGDPRSRGSADLHHRAASRHHAAGAHPEPRRLLRQPHPRRRRDGRRRAARRIRPTKRARSSRRANSRPSASGRSPATGRISGFQAWPADEVRRLLNETTTVIVMLETPEAIEHAEEIAAVPGRRHPAHRHDRSVRRDGYAREVRGPCGRAELRARDRRLPRARQGRGRRRARHRDRRDAEGACGWACASSPPVTNGRSCWRRRGSAPPCCAQFELD